MNGIAWSRIVWAAERRLVAMTAEMAGYLVLGVVDILGGRAGEATSDEIRLDEEGRVLLLRVIPCSRQLSDRYLRQLLKTMLDVSVSSCSALARAASLDECDSVASDFAGELQKALIPVNRAAARRALARLYRELAKVNQFVERDNTRHQGSCLDDASMGYESPRCRVTSGAYQESHPELKRRRVAPGAGEVGSRFGALPQETEEGRGGERAAQQPSACVEWLTRLSASGTCGVGISDLGDDASCESEGRADHYQAISEPIRALQSVVCERGYDDVWRMSAMTEEHVGEVPGTGLHVGTADCALLEIPDLEVPTRERAAVEVATGANDLAGQRLTDDSSFEPVSEQGVAADSTGSADQPAPEIASLESAGVDLRPLTNCSAATVVRETTLVMAPVVGNSKIERTVPLALGVSEPQAEVASDALSAAQILAIVAEPTMALPLVTRRRTVPLQVEAESSGASINWDQTTIDAVTEIRDEEIRYEDSPGEDIWVAIDSTDESDFLVESQAVESQAVESQAVESQAVESQAVESQAVESLEEVGCAVDLPVGADSDAALVGGSSDSHTGFSQQIESKTHYCSDDGARATSYSTIEALAGQFVIEPLWTDDQLRRSLRTLAGMDSSPVALSHTPPPTVENMEFQTPEQLEPTRRLRHLGAALVAGVAIGGLVYGTQLLGGVTALASPLPGDALSQICRATVVVAGVEPEQRVQIRQAGDDHFREPTRIVGTNASFSGMRCGRDAELLVVDSDADGLRRIPISGIRLQPRDTHPWAVGELRLDSSS